MAKLHFFPSKASLQVARSNFTSYKMQLYKLQAFSCFCPVPEDFDAVSVALVVVVKLLLQPLQPSVQMSETTKNQSKQKPYE
jgi:hypothetical protein